MKSTSVTTSDARLGALGDIPLIVLQAGRMLQANDALGFGRELADATNHTWERLQTELAGLSPQGRRVMVPDCGHEIQLERPQAVIDAIHEVVQRVRAGGSV